MFLIVISIPIYTLAIVAMFYMDTFFKALMFLVLLLAVTFILFLFIDYPLPSALSVLSMMLLKRLKRILIIN
ncbi:MULTISPECIES: hypothetical protein [unclassified Pedobacter]|jgi:hypothetical protein|uniref:hypothetical protein n=1 Tax=Pedobacter TaxID=84567 RepID=UPI000B4A86E7|nr:MULTISPECIES: hypothetical protein [unclassified Pedobacter]MCX2583322.1 hypothetical protein [Pedobacter sp. MR22-3]OWK72023.1 hypothetical protein CBW18_00070 [Pedobacter sp. AJM]